MIKTNNEVVDDCNNSWLLMYSFGSSFYIPDALHVERNDALMLVEGDEEACREAEKDGIKLIYDIEGIPKGVYVDTEENRQIIADNLIVYPQYKNSIEWI